MKRLELYLFAFAWLTYAYFHQGGGWNQNGRFAMTRALVESRVPWIDDYIVYASSGPKGSPVLRRVPVKNGLFTDAERTFALAWVMDNTRTPMAPDAPKDARLAPVDWAAASGDLAYARGHIHPNKAPGASFLAVPGYALVFGIERLLGVDPDAAIVMNVNAWLAGVLSVGLLSALGVVVLFRLALRFSGGDARDALSATLALAFGSLYFPYATMLYEHDLVAVFLLAAFASAFDAHKPSRLVAAGACAGAAFVSSYLAVFGLAILGLYILWRGRSLPHAVAFAAGTIPPLAALAAYNVVCFGTVLTTNYAWQNPAFQEAGGGLAAVFSSPRLDVLAALLISPFRGLFTGAPVLVLGAIGLVAMLRQPRFRAEGLVCSAMVLHVLLFNMSFTNWNGGWGCGPRYLIPALPFLALPIAAFSVRPALGAPCASRTVDRRDDDRHGRRSAAARMERPHVEAQPDLGPGSSPARQRTTERLRGGHLAGRIRRATCRAGLREYWRDLRGNRRAFLRNRHEAGAAQLVQRR